MPNSTNDAGSGVAVPSIVPTPSAEKVSKPRLSADGKTLSVSGPDLRKGRVYEIQLDGVKSAEGEKLLHGEAYYTLNELLK